MEPGRGLGVFHEPVLLEEVLAFLSPKPGKLLVDATVGTGGHAEAFLSAGARVIGIDQDPQSLALASARLSSFSFRWLVKVLKSPLLDGNDPCRLIRRTTAADSGQGGTRSEVPWDRVKTPLGGHPSLPVDPPPPCFRKGGE